MNAIGKILKYVKTSFRSKSSSKEIDDIAHIHVYHDEYSLKHGMSRCHASPTTPAPAFSFDSH